MKQVELSFTGLGKLLKSDTKVWFCKIPVDLWLFGLGSLNLCALKTQTGLSHLFRRDIDQSRCVLSLACKYKGWTAVERGFWWLFNIRTSGWCDMRPGRPKLGLTLGKQQVYYRKLRDDARKSRGSSFRFLTLTILLISGFALLLCSLAWEHIKTLLPAFARRFCYKKRVATVFWSHRYWSWWRSKEKSIAVEFSLRRGLALLCSSTWTAFLVMNDILKKFAKSWSHNYFIWKKLPPVLVENFPNVKGQKFTETPDSDIISGNFWCPSPQHWFPTKNIDFGAFFWQIGWSHIQHHQPFFEP